MSSSLMQRENMRPSPVNTEAFFIGNIFDHNLGFGLRIAWKRDLRLLFSKALTQGEDG